MSPAEDCAIFRAAAAPPVGREGPLERLRLSLDQAASGGCRVVLVAGGAGVGKSALMQQLRPFAQARRAQFVAGKFEQHNERESTAVLQALSALGQLLLADYDQDELAEVRGRMLRALGAQAGLARVVPEFAQLLGDLPDPMEVDPAHAAARLVEVVVGLLRAIASPARPVVFVLDDLQWSGTLSTRLIEAILATNDIKGLLLVAAYRDDELPQAHPLISAIAYWAKQDGALELLPLANLKPPEVTQLLTQLLGPLPGSWARRLGEAMGRHAQGNPFDTVELLNALRDEGLLPGAGAGVRWDDDAVQEYLARNPMKDVLGVRIERLPGQAQELLQALACIGAQTSLEVARTLAPFSPEEFESALAVLCERSFVQTEGAAKGVVRLRHDRVQQAAYASLPQHRRGVFHLGLARRLASAGLAPLAADQYVCAADEVHDAAESQRAALLLTDAALQTRRMGNPVAACRMQYAAMRLLERARETGEDNAAALAACEIDYHLALFTVGRLEAADAVYERIQSRHPNALRYIGAACLQVDSLGNRGRLDDAVALGLQVLRSLGLDVPRDFGASPDFSDRLERMRRWVETFDLDHECTRAETTVPWVMASAKMIYRLLSPAIVTDVNMLAWLIFKSQDLWEQHGPCAPLVVSFSRSGVATIAFTQDWRTGYLAMRHPIDLCEARRWEPEGSRVRFIFVANGIYWFEPLERTRHEAERAREGLVAGGDLRSASFSYRTSAICLFECGPTLRRYAQEVEGALVLSRRADNRQAIVRCLEDREVLRELVGEDTSQGTLPDSHGLSEGMVDASDPWVRSYHACSRAALCAIFADGAGLARHARVALHLQSALHFYRKVWAYWLTGLGAAWEIQGTAGAVAEPGSDPWVELDASLEWMRQRAIDAPFNFRHLHLHLLAERAWAVGDLPSATRWFDNAMGAAEQAGRPWHQALISERAARLHLALGWTHSGSQLLLEAQQLYMAWGATVKASQLSAQTGTPADALPHASPFAASRALTAADDLDMRVVLQASQGLSAEVNSLRLKAKVQEVLSSATGATRVTLALWEDDAAEWLVDARDSSGEVIQVPVDGSASAVPLKAFRYAESTREPLLLVDAVSDERFARDVYFHGMERCSLMVVPILRRGVERAMLVLENRASRGAFTMALLDAVTIISGQLAVSLESMLLYERLERKVREQTRQLREAQSRQVAEARRAGMTQIATNVLHDVGNALTSVNVSTHVLADRVRNSRSVRVSDLAQLLAESSHEWQRFCSERGKGRLLPGYVRQLAGALQVERDELLAELQRLSRSVDHIKNVVAMQQSYAGASGVLESCNIAQLVDDALRIQQDALIGQGITVDRNYAAVDPAPLDKTRVMQILVNLVENARQAMEGVQGRRTLRVTVGKDAQDLLVTVGDNGSGIAPGHLSRMFSHGFTTKSGGHGFGLHSCAVAAKEMGGTLTVHSEGAGTGATFTLRLPSTGAANAGN